MSGAQSRPAPGPIAPTPLRDAVSACRTQFVHVGLFSGVVNVLQLTVSLYMMQVFDRVMATRNLDTLIYLTLIAIAAIGLLALLEAVRSQVMQRIGQWMEQSVGPEGFSRALEAQLRGQPYRAEALRDLATCRAYLGSPAALALFDVPWVPVYLLVIFLLHPILGALAVGAAILLFGLTLVSEVATAGPLRQANTAIMAAQRRSDAMLRNAEVIDSMGMHNAVLARWQAGAAEQAAPTRHAADRTALLLSLTKFFRLGVQIALLGLGAWLALQQEMTSGASIAGSIIMGRALAPVEQLIGGWKQLVQARQSWRRLNAFLAMPRARPPGVALPPPKGRLSVEQASYAFAGHSGPTLRGINFKLEPGESLAIIGPSAAGKTTLLRLLTGTMKPMAGHVRLDGADVFSWLREDFGRHVGYLPQDVELFDGTVIDNIARLGDPDSEAVFAATKLAGCHDMILRLPQGYDTPIGEGGQHLSGGQRQLIGLARAFYGNPRFIVLDEPNSNLDGDAEGLLLQALHALKATGSTVVFVSHRPMLVQGADKVLLLRDGAMEMFGPRAEVLKKLMQPVARPVPAPAAREGQGHG